MIFYSGKGFFKRNKEYVEMNPEIVAKMGE